jgi:Resolvase, N terminal domain
MNAPVSKLARCAIYTRKSTEYNLELAFNSLDAQREACEAYIKSQAHEGWRLIPARYDDGAFSGASLERPALQQLLVDVRAGKQRERCRGDCTGDDRTPFRIEDSLHQGPRACRQAWIRRRARAALRGE